MLIAFSASLLFSLLLLVPRRAWSKDGPSLFDSEEVAAVRRNIERYDWARAERDFVLEECERWIAMSDADLWALVTGQAVPRGIHTHLKLGCPSCGRARRSRRNAACAGLAV